MNNVPDGSPLTSSQHRHLEQEYSEMQGKYDSLTKAIAALDTDIGRILEEHRKQPLAEMRAEKVAERDQVANRLSQIEEQLGHGTVQAGQAAEPSVAETTTPAPATPPPTLTAGTTSQNQPPVPSKRGCLGWFHQLSDASKAAVIVAVITGIFTVVVALISLLGDVIPPSNGPEPTPSPMTYVVRVEGQDSAGTGIKDAKVTLEVPGRPPLDAFTDSDGVAAITVPAQYIGGSAVMIVEAPDFAPFRQNITMYAGMLPPLVRLALAANTPEITVTHTPTPTTLSPTNAAYFNVYTAGDAPDNHFTPTNYMGDLGDITIVENWQGDRDPARSSVIKIVYDPRERGDAQGNHKCMQDIPQLTPCQWAGVYWTHPANNWGEMPEEGYNLTGFNKLTFWARRDEQPVVARFRVGGIGHGIPTPPAYPDSIQSPVETGWLPLEPEWISYTIDLQEQDLSHVIGGFGWSISWNNARIAAGSPPLVFYLDDIRFER